MPVLGILTWKLRARSGSNPMMMNSEVPMPKAETASASRGFRIGHSYCPRFLLENGRRRSREAQNDRYAHRLLQPERFQSGSSIKTFART